MNYWKLFTNFVLVFATFSLFFGHDLRVENFVNLFQWSEWNVIEYALMVMIPFSVVSGSLE